MIYQSQLSTLGAAADAEIASLNSQVSSLQTAVKVAQAENQALKDKIETLLPAVKCGTNIENPAAQVAKDALYGKGKVARVFYSSIPKKGVYDGPVDRLVMVSVKCDVVALIKGTLDTAMVAFLSSLPKGSIFTLWHEPEDNIANGEYTAAQFRAAQMYVKSLIAKRGLDLKFALILMGYTLTAASKRTFSDYWSPGVYDYLGFDCYNTSTTVYTAPEKVFGPSVAKAKELSIPLLIPEWASRVVGQDTAGRAAWITASGAYMRDNGVYAATYFDHPVDKADWRASTDAASTQALRALIS